MGSFLRCAADGLWERRSCCNPFQEPPGGLRQQGESARPRVRGVSCKTTSSLGVGIPAHMEAETCQKSLDDMQGAFGEA